MCKGAGKIWKMKKVKAAVAVSIIRIVLLANLAGLSRGALEVGFYRGKCGIADVEMIVAGVVTARFIKDPTVVAALIRLQFHDCFVNGCDASILIDGNHSEKTAIPNQTIRGYDIIDEAKAAVERICPGVVSCSDLITMASRDAVFLGGGGRYEVQTGRRDGLLSLAENVTMSIVGPSVSVPETVELFASRGLNLKDMVLLMGGHSVGVAHCALFHDRLYNFQNTGSPDPIMDPALANLLRSRCPFNTTTATTATTTATPTAAAAKNDTVDLDQNTFQIPVIDNSYYKQLMLNRGVLQLDQDMASHPLTSATVMSLADALDFHEQFGAAMVKMGAIEVLTGMQGEIRRFCRATNWPPYT